MKSAHLPTRREIPDRYKWRLEDIYPGDDAVERDFQQTLELAARVESYQGKLGTSARVLLEAFQLQEQLDMLNEKIYTYARMRRDEDNTNPVYQALSDRAESLNARVQAAVSFFVPEILALPGQTLKKFLQEEPGLALYRFMLEELVRQKPHTLSASEEQIMARAQEVTQAAANIFRMINNADFTFDPVKDERGREVELTHGRYLQFMESRDRRVRRDAFTSLYRTYRRFQNTLAATLGASVKKDVFYARVRKYPSALEAALFADNIPVQVYDNLIRTVRGNLEPFYRYMRLRKKLLGIDELHMYDIYTPVVKDVEWTIPYPEAVEMVREGLAPLGKDYVETMTGGIGAGWVDVYENKGKTSGAYSWGPYGTHPYVLLNYQDNLNNVFTLAHEMGHAMHSYYSFKSQPYVYAHYKIFTAEVASTVNESLLMQYLLQTVKEREKKIYLLNHYLEQFRGTVYRQTMFAEFEKIIHEQVEAGEALTPELLCTIYHQLNVDYYGPEVVVDRDIDMEWARIPHFYTAFYVYKYATGFSAATALTRRISSEGSGAVERYIDFLSRGGSDYPLQLLNSAGVDMTSPRPVQECLDVFARLVGELESMALGVPGACEL
ncbi:oligopeptidase F Metallo peptidase MEROPS family M03B [Desulfallas thermosapovorans DSM 6562]|uniref:Oligopeptidase F n=1 Tax=Desulfallas thermosapovorans DSM 6562 TaxID=1121431 RepID=A0A5S4ZUX7_9FIRM|nr:oligoendopeptidase F [Desulfallas thermosapovorans]TYO95902.1 oligopeptidase F Metallo peptidase MEROPS family M03B [Desulfallas thermosapovorans DSM 6562]